MGFQQLQLLAAERSKRNIELTLVYAFVNSIDLFFIDTDPDRQACEQNSQSLSTEDKSPF